MNKRLPMNYLKTYRERTGFLLQDMAQIIGMHSGNLSKIETGQVTPSIEVVLAYHIILNRPIERLCKNHVKEGLHEMLLRSEALKEQLLEHQILASISKRLDLLNIIIDRLKEVQEYYAKQ
jgi:transcriptional regulator with XRE-family HTH domain